MKLNSSYKTLTGNASNGKIPSFTISRKAEGWEYGVGDLSIRVRAKEEDEWIYYHLDIYHTGFFHYDAHEALCGPNHRTGNPDLYDGKNEPSTKGIYYEVVKMGNNYWLDRNLGATSAQYYVMSNTGTTYHGDPAAAGIYYRVAEYNKHNDPTMRTHICPPGYNYPTEYDFEGLTKSAEFNTSTKDNYYDASYLAVAPTTANPSGKTVYFPRAGYVDKEHKFTSAESRAGYYWTSTAARGMEKEEIGAWISAFSLSGAGSSFVNAAVYSLGYDYKVDGVDRTNAGYAMPVRCVAKRTEQNKEPAYVQTNFFVTGATHVFLFTRDGDNVTPVQPWPGIGIADFNTASKKFNLTYTSKTFKPENLYVIFNFKDERGIIHTFSKGTTPNGIAAVHTTDKGPKSLYGWPVKDGEVYEGGFSGSNISATTTKGTSQLGSSWLVGFVGKAPGTMISGGTAAVLLAGGTTPPPPPATAKYRVYWLKTQSGGINMWTNTNKGIVNAVFSDGSQAGDSKGYFHSSEKGYVYYEFDQSYVQGASNIKWAYNNSSERGNFDISKFSDDQDGVPSVVINFATKDVTGGGPNLEDDPEWKILKVKWCYEYGDNYRDGVQFKGFPEGAVRMDGGQLPQDQKDPNKQAAMESNQNERYYYFKIPYNTDGTAEVKIGFFRYSDWKYWSEKSMKVSDFKNKENHSTYGTVYSTDLIGF